MGWRYNVIVLGAMTLAVFFLRYFVFRFHESPKFLLSRGKEAEAIEVLHRIAKFNKAPPPQLTLEMFQMIDETESATTNSAIMASQGGKSTAATTKHVVKGFTKELRRLKGIFTNKLSALVFVLFYTSPLPPTRILIKHTCREITGPSTSQEVSCHLSCCVTTSTAVAVP
jgi:hypothetical protein